MQGILQEIKMLGASKLIIAPTKIPVKGTNLFGPLSCCSKTRKSVTESAKISSPRCSPVSVVLNQSVFALRVTSLRALRTNAWSYWGLSLKVGQKVSAAHPNASRHTPAPPALKLPPARDAEGLRFLRCSLHFSSFLCFLRVPICFCSPPSRSLYFNHVDGGAVLHPLYPGGPSPGVSARGAVPRCDLECVYPESRKLVKITFLVIY